MRDKRGDQGGLANALCNDNREASESLNERKQEERNKGVIKASRGSNNSKGKHVTPSMATEDAEERYVESSTKATSKEHAAENERKASHHRQEPTQ